MFSCWLRKTETLSLLVMWLRPNARLQLRRRMIAPAAVGCQPMLAGSSAQNDIDAVKDLRARLRPQAPDPLGEE